jgi:hypothetical protein
MVSRLFIAFVCRSCYQIHFADLPYPGVFGVTTPYKGGGEKGEIEQGMNIIAAAKVCECVQSCNF